MMFPAKDSSSLSNHIFFLIGVFLTWKATMAFLFKSLIFPKCVLGIGEICVEIIIIFTKVTHEKEQVPHIYEHICCLS